VFAGCEYFNAPLKEFMDMNTAKVALGGVSVGVQAGGSRFIEHPAGAILSQMVPVTLDNPQQFNIKVVVKSAAVNGTPAPNVTVESWTKNEAMLKIAGALNAERYDITLRVTSKDGVSRGERVFDITMPPVLFHSRLETTISKPDVSLSASPLPANFPIAHWKTQKNATHTGINKIVIEYKYFDPDASTMRSKAYTYGWDDFKPVAEMLREGTGSAQGFLASDAGAYWNCAFLLPHGAGDPVSAALTAASLKGCSFKVTVYDKFGLVAEAASPGFDSGYGAYYAAKRGSSLYYKTLPDAIAAASGASAAPDEITVLADIDMTSASNIAVSSGKYIKLVSLPGGEPRVLKRAADNTADPLFTVNGGLTLENIIVDGGAVWAGGTASPPSPAFGASNTGGLTATKPLIIASGAGAKLTLGAGAVLRNICISSGDDRAGGGMRADTGAEVIINGGEVCYNQSGYTGGGIVLQDSSQMNTKLTLISGSINNNKSYPHDGGGINAEYGIIKIQGGSITKNRANTTGGGINVNAGGASTMTISGGEISGNIAGQKGGGIKAGQNYTVTMSGGTISGNSASGTTIDDGGGGVYVARESAAGSFIMSSGMITGNTSEKLGGGVFAHSGGDFQMSGGTISGNTAGHSGGGVAVRGTGSAFTMSGTARISGNNSVYGAGVGIEQTESAFTMSGAAIISGNIGTGYGGGVLNHGTFTMNGGTISANKGDGGGVYLYATGVFTMNGGDISGNESLDNGGGVSIGNTATFDHYGGTISGNTAPGSGSGVYNANVFRMSGGARIAANNNVYLLSGKTIEITGNLTGATTVATVTPQTYTDGVTQVLSGTALSANYSKFAVTPNAAMQYVINNEGKLALYSQSLASGGTVTFPQDSGETYELHVFTASGTFTLDTAPAFPNSFEILVVGGGGGGGGGSSLNSGGGGGGGVVNHRTAQTVPAGSYTVTVGSGGNGGATGDFNTPGATGSSGSQSVFGSFTAAGGGGGTGGGAGANSIAGAGTGGQGGGGSAGENFSTGNPGNANTGGGGAGGASYPKPGYAGGSGVVIVRFRVQ
jgi:hypothetical protein